MEPRSEYCQPMIRERRQIIVELEGPADDPCEVEIDPPFLPGDVVRYCGTASGTNSSHYSHLQTTGDVEWCRLSRIGVNPPAWTVGVRWRYREGYVKTRWQGQSRARYLASNLCLVERPTIPNAPTGWPVRAEDAMRAEDV